MKGRVFMESTTIYFYADENHPNYSANYSRAIIEIKDGYLVTTYYSTWNSSYNYVTKVKL